MNEIKELIANYPKHYSVMIKKNPIYKKWIEDNSLLLEKANWTDHIRSALFQETNICIIGNTKKLKAIDVGFGFCGTASKCECARKSVSKSISLTKSLRTPEEILIENKKRETTSLKKYGVINNAQTTVAKTSHKALYLDQTKVDAISNRIKNSKLIAHGDCNFNNRSKAEQTCLTKYGVKNTWSTTDDKQNPKLQLLKDKANLHGLFPKYTVEEIASQCEVHIQTVYYYLNLHGFREPYKSTFEQEIVFFLRGLGVANIITNTRKLIGKEIDIFLPDYNLAIEYNGLFWHHDKIPHITKTYHFDKFNECESKGITLFTIFGNSWENKKEIWKNKIKAKLNLTGAKVYARNTKLVKLKPSETKIILNDHHVQGYCVSQLCYGLTYMDNLVAVMTFSKKRNGIGKQRAENSYELVRYVTNISVVGGASKLLSHFIKSHSPAEIISYSDNLYSTGSLYKILGFSLENENKCGYWYYDPQHKKSYHRMNFTKNKLIKNGFDLNKTEKEIMDSRGFLRIWDCGSRTWVLHVKH